jgi:Tfp pilus assembly protein PilF
VPDPGRLALAAALLCVLVHAPTLGAGFVYDDYPYVVDNADLRGGLSRVPRLFGESFPSHAPDRGLYRPLTATSLRLDRVGGPLLPWRHHLTNLLLAGGLVLAVFAALRRVVPDPAAAWAALVFAVHPVHVEAIAWVSGRSELLAALFACVAFALGVDAARRGGAVRIAGAAAALLLGLLSKENAAVAVPLVAGALWLGPGPAAPRRRAIAVVAVLCGAALGALALRTAVLGALGPSASDRGGAASLAGRLPLVVAATGEHLRLLLWPHPLSIERMPAAPSAWGDDAVIGGAVVLGAWAVALVACRRRCDLFFLLAWPVVALLPVQHWVPIGETVAERFLLLPSVGVCGALGTIVVSLAMSPRARTATLAVLVAAGTVASAARAVVWRDEDALWRDALRHAPESVVPWAALGDAQRRRGDWPAAVDSYRRALAIRPDLTVTRLSLADALDAAGRTDDAFEESREAVHRDPEHPVALNNFGARLARAGRVEEARKFFRRAVENSPGYAPALRNAALAALDEGDPDEARALLARARAADPELPGLDAIAARLR